MASKDWYPTKLGDLIPWHTNFNTQALLTGVNRGLTAAQVLQITADLNTVMVVVNASVAAKDFAEALTAYREIILNGELGVPIPSIPLPPVALTIGAAGLPSIQARTRQYAGIIKAGPTYTQSVGELYGIVPPGPAPAAAPTIRQAIAKGGTEEIVLSLFKGGYSVIAVDMKRGAGAFTQIGVSQLAEFTDTTPPLVPGQPELRQYRVQGMVANQRVGAVSAVVSAVTVP